MLHSRADFRVGLHSLPDRSRHGDLFIPLPGREGLLTFQIDTAALELLEPPLQGIVLVLADSSLKPVVRGRFRMFEDAAALFSRGAGSVMKVPLKPRADHRPMYMTYSGRVETRGDLEDFARGKLDGFAFDRENYLVIER